MIFRQITIVSCFQPGHPMDGFNREQYPWVTGKSSPFQRFLRLTTNKCNWVVPNESKSFDWRPVALRNRSRGVLPGLTPPAACPPAHFTPLIKHLFAVCRFDCIFQCAVGDPRWGGINKCGMWAASIPTRKTILPGALHTQNRISWS